MNLKLRFIRLVNGMFPERFCWADCVAWAYSDSWNFLSIDRPDGCKEDSKTKEACWCGGFVDGKLYCKMSQAEKDSHRPEPTIDLVDDLPF